MTLFGLKERISLQLESRCYLNALSRQMLEKRFVSCCIGE